MKNYKLLILLFVLGYCFFSCTKEDQKSERFILLTGNTWIADSLLLDGVEAGGPGGLLEKFNGETKFNDDGTGHVGNIAGTWEFFSNETQIVINSDSLAIPVTTKIAELTSESLKLTASYPMPGLPPVIKAVRMTFKPK